ncbi:MAG: glycoside hydrolase family 3 C-terminal domain-containing protein, partial [Candidatus Binatia bacterium]
AYLLKHVIHDWNDERAGAILRTMFAFGLFDRAAHPHDDELIDKAGHAALVEEVAEEGLVLLTNDGILPLDADALGSIAVIGDAAVRYVGGGGSSAVQPFEVRTSLDAITERAGDAVEVRYRSGGDRAAAVALARDADVAIVFGNDTASEGGDKTCLSLTCPLGIPPEPSQDDLIDAVIAANPRSIVVLQTGGPVLTPWRERAAALIEAWYPGQRGGAAIARVLFGDTDPGGRLPMTFPKRVGDLPTAGDLLRYPGNGLQVFYSEGPLVGYRWYDAEGVEPAFPFGHGLSYTTFGYGDLEIHDDRIEAIVSNVGSRTGSEVAQLYVAIPAPGPGLAQPPRQLKGFAKVELEADESARVSFPIDDRTFAHWDEEADAWATAPACYGVSVGSSSRDLRLEGVIARGGGSCP